MPTAAPPDFPWSLVPAPAPGERQVGYLTWPDPAFAGLQWPYFALRGREAGPAVVVIAAIHGGEYPGPLGAIRLGRETDPAALRGTLLVLPLVNLPAFWARAAFSTPTDGKNLGRAFPGRPDGTFCEVLAHRLLADVVQPADAVIDLHSGDICEALADHAGRYRSDDPETEARSARMLRAFGLPYSGLYPTPVAPGGLTGNATRLGKATIFVEVGGNGLASDADVAAVHCGLVDTLRALGNLPGTPTPRPSRAIWPAAQVVAPVSGLWRPVVATEQLVAVGDLLGTISDPLGEPLAEVLAPTGGMVLYHLTTLAAHAGEPLVNLVGLER